MGIAKIVSVADVFTLVNVLFGLCSIIIVMRGNWLLGGILILLGILADGLDGIFARRFSKKWYLGDYLDLMADTVTFCVAPAVLMFTYYTISMKLMSFTSILLFIGAGAMVILGILRLARFCYLKGAQSQIFIGLPTPGMALCMVILILTSGYVIEISPFVIFIFSIVLSYLMVSEIPYPKVSGAWAFISALPILLTITGAFLFISIYHYIILIALFLSLGYIVLGPVSIIFHPQQMEEKTEEGLE